MTAPASRRWGCYERGDRTFGAKRCALTRKVLWHQGLSRDRVIQLIPFCKLLIFLRISVATVSIRTENTTTPRWCHRPASTLGPSAIGPPAQTARRPAHCAPAGDESSSGLWHRELGGFPGRSFAAHDRQLR